MDQLNIALIATQVAKTLKNNKHVCVLMGLSPKEENTLYEILYLCPDISFIHVKNIQIYGDGSTRPSQPDFDNINCLFVHSLGELRNYRHIMCAQENKNKILVIDAGFEVENDYVYKQYAKFFKNVIFVLKETDLAKAVLSLMEMDQHLKLNVPLSEMIGFTVHIQDDPITGVSVKVISNEQLFRDHQYVKAIRFTEVDCPKCSITKMYVSPICIHVPGLHKVKTNRRKCITDIELACSECGTTFMIADYEIIDYGKEKEVEAVYNKKVQVYD